MAIAFFLKKGHKREIQLASHSLRDIKYNYIISLRTKTMMINAFHDVFVGTFFLKLLGFFSM